MAATKAWTVLTLADLTPYCVDGQLSVVEKWKSIDDPGGDTDQNAPAEQCPFQQVMKDVAGEVRTAIASNPANTLSATPYALPPELKRTAIYILMDALQAHFSLATGLTDSQLKQAEAAKGVLERVRNWTRQAQGEQFLISAPEDPETEPAQAYRTPATAVAYKERLLTRETLAGL